MLEIIHALYYRSLKPGVMDDFRVSGASDPASSVITQVCDQILSILITSIVILFFQMLWGHTTHIGCGWAQIDVGDNRYDYPGRWDDYNFKVLT